MGLFRRKCWHVWGFWFYITQDLKTQRKECMKCHIGKIRKTPRYIREWSGV